MQYEVAISTPIYLLLIRLTKGRSCAVAEKCELLLLFRTYAVTRVMPVLPSAERYFYFFGFSAFALAERKRGKH